METKEELNNSTEDSNNEIVHKYDKTQTAKKESINELIIAVVIIIVMIIIGIVVLGINI